MLLELPSAASRSPQGLRTTPIVPKVPTHHTASGISLSCVGVTYNDPKSFGTAQVIQITCAYVATGTAVNLDGVRKSLLSVSIAPHGWP